MITQRLSIMLLATIGISMSIPFAASAKQLSSDKSAPVLLAQAPIIAARKHAPATRRPDMRKAVAALPAKSRKAKDAREIRTRNTPENDDFNADDLIGASLYDMAPGGATPSNLEFSGRSGPQLRIGMRQKKVRFALNFKVDEDVYFAPAYRLAIARGDFQNPNGYTAHSVFFGMRFRLGGRRQ